LALLAPLAGSAEAGVGDSTGGALSSFGRLSPVQTVQYDGDCWYDNGSNGPGYYPCGNEWNNGLGGGAVSPIVGPAIRRHHHHGVIVTHPQARNPVYPGAASRRLGAGVPSLSLRGSVGTPAFGGGPRFRQFGAAGVHTSPGLHAGAATVSPGFAGGGFHGGLGGGRFHQFHGSGVPHIGAPVSPGFAGGGGLHGLGGATGVHMGAPASPGFAGVGGFHGGGGLHGLGGATGVHIGSPASPSFAGLGTFHAGGGFHGFGGGGGAHIGAFASPGFAGGGFHGVGGAGTFQGGGAAFGQGGIGHR
jgi:hypothetical protein